MTGRRVDWQPLPGTPPAACLTPPGSTVLASGDTATVSVDSPPGVYGWTVTGCLLAEGRERVLASGFGGYEAPFLNDAVVAGTLAALEVTPSCGTYSLRAAPSITVYDLQTGKASDYFGSGVGGECKYGIPPTIDPLLLGANGFAAWLVTYHPDGSEQLYARDDQGTNAVDSAPAGSGQAIANIQLTGDQLTWTNNGTPRELTLQ